MSKVEDILAKAKLNEIIKKKEDKKCGKVILKVLAVVGIVAVIAAIVYAVYRYFNPNEAYDFADDFEDDFDEDFFDDDDDVVVDDVFVE